MDEWMVKMYEPRSGETIESYFSSEKKAKDFYASLARRDYSAELWDLEHYIKLAATYDNDI